VQDNKKVKNAVLDYSVNWEQWLNGDTISSSSWSCPGLTITAQTVNAEATRTTVVVSGGDVGRKYTLTNRILTAGGLTDERSIHIHVVDHKEE
jgi:hypothetical protein